MLLKWFFWEKKVCVLLDEFCDLWENIYGCLLLDINTWNLKHIYYVEFLKLIMMNMNDFLDKWWLLYLCTCLCVYIYIRFSLIEIVMMISYVYICIYCSWWAKRLYWRIVSINYLLSVLLIYIINWLQICLNGCAWMDIAYCNCCNWWTY